MADHDDTKPPSTGELPDGETTATDPSDIPEEWLAAFVDDEPSAAAVPEPGEDPGASGADLLGEWEAWQAKQAGGDPFDLLSDGGGAPQGASYEEVLSARAEVLGSEADVAVLSGLEDPAAAADPAAPAQEDAAAAQEVAAVAVVASAGSPEPAASHAAAAEPQRARPLGLPGARRVVVHLADGQARRGQVIDPELPQDSFTFIGASGASESVRSAELRTIFFMRAPGVAAQVASGDAIQLILRDGRELSGRSADHASGGAGFTLVPDEARSPAALVWVSRSAVRSLAVR